MELTLIKWLIFLVCIGATAYLGVKKPSLLISILAGGIALEISIEWLPQEGLLGSQLGSLARIFTVGIIAAAAVRLWKEPETRCRLWGIMNHYLTRALMIYIAVGGFSLIYSVGRGKTVLEVIRLLTLFLLYLGTVLLAEKKHDFLPMQVVHWVGIALVPLALYEGATRNFIWRGYLAEGMLARVNATFVDPNIFARYLVLAIVANLLIQYFTEKAWKRAVYIACLLCLMGGLAITLSRSGMLTLAIILVLMVFLIPRKPILQPIGFLGLIGAVIVAMRPTIWQRLLTFREGLGALDAQRLYLWKAAWAMFKDHPLLGVGLGGFRKMFETQYIQYKTVIPDAEGATLSHTTILTIAAELGLLGLAALAWVWLAIMRALHSLRKLARQQEKLRGYCLGVGYFLWIMTVFISSQAEARFFEDPAVWLSMGMMVHLLSQGNERNA
ncbi:lipid A core-O-antigen ligase-like enyme [Desulfosporosinus orientis DSM 765]|uniref:Lipid A core-O-antigen ligase-like enyme n=1 Tax=Desulfosporosinus orientis (strain ATCC 19365 / DSM 765 / NCIMB 8382 / VKM B-1628 / Singapore I) TaxID=768706 RepID=G7WC88_DESOD|nr:O-antigen ligase family protein [Desulfosporosinus orientis]AET70706.1 lipid A core-O-antigen ligase-like enyme [Desulfosporosinus orientis DSM 765]